MSTCTSDKFPTAFDVRENQNEESWVRGLVGTKNWNQDQVYDGELFRGAIHGRGAYRWNNNGIYEGGFYSNSKDGYGFVSYPDNSSFEGLFVKNQPFGPGVRTHANGRQDAGFWVGRKLVRLSRSIDYVVPRLAPTPAGKIKLLRFRRLISLTEDSFDSADEILNGMHRSFRLFFRSRTNPIHDPRSVFFDKLSFEKAYFERSTHKPEESSLIQKETLTKPCLNEPVWNIEGPCPNDDDCDSWEVSKDSEKGFLEELAQHLQHSEQSFKEESLRSELAFSQENSQQNIEDESLFPPKLISWNRSELCTDMLKQIYRHREFEEEVSFTVGKLMLGERTAFRKTGRTEALCLGFLKLCSSGPARVVKELLCDGEISNDLMDGRGNTSLMFAAATDQRDIIDVLLDHGVDVNTFNDENLTPLNLCLLRRLSEVHRVRDWETAFLPPESTETSDPNTVEWRATESIRSLDRIFGDGTSLIDEDNSTTDRVSTKKEPSEMKVPSTKESLQFKTVSQMTMIHFKKGMKANGKVSSSSFDDMSTPFPSDSSGARFKAQTKSSSFSARTRYLFQLTPMSRPTASNRRLSVHVSIPNLEGKSDSRLAERIKEIDKTIDKLLQRGADPNIAEVPKPSIHLAVFTKDPSVVRSLLLYGASPDRQLCFAEGLLTPLHVVALLPSAPEYANICQLLLDFGADPEEETSPEFLIFEEEDKSRLNIFQGRTPLQLLCMRPDLEYVDADGFLMTIALALARVSNKKHFFNGHSYLTLTMLCGNLRLLQALLDSKFFDPNQILGEGLGTALHVLVSTNFQLKTLYDSSIKMCDMLLAAGADPSKKLDYPENVAGTCIDFGYAEIEREKARRKLTESSKKESRNTKTEKSQARDHLKDHIRVVEYLEKVSTGTNETRLQSSQPGTKNKAVEKNQEKIKTGEDNRNEKAGSAAMKGSGYLKEKGVLGSKEKSAPGSKDKGTNLQTSQQEAGSLGPKDSKRKPGIGQGKQAGEDDSKQEFDKRENSLKIPKRRESKEKKPAEVGSKATRKNKQREKPDSELVHSKKRKGSKLARKKKRSKTDRQRKDKKRRLDRQMGGEFPSTKRLASSHSAAFSESLRRSLLRLFGNCLGVDPSQFLLPYIVFRNGDLYYRFQGKATDRKEQYSLI